MVVFIAILPQIGLSFQIITYFVLQHSADTYNSAYNNDITTILIAETKVSKHVTNFKLRFLIL